MLKKSDKSAPCEHATAAFVQVHDATIPAVIATGSMGGANTVASAKDHAAIVSWGDRAYDDASYFSSFASFATSAYPPVHYPVNLFTLMGTEHNSGLVAMDAYVYALDISKPRGSDRWHLIAIGQCVVLGRRGPIECVYLDTKLESMHFCDRRGETLATMHMPRATHSIRVMSHI
jgi:hypothetical protein